MAASIPESYVHERASTARCVRRVARVPLPSSVLVTTSDADRSRLLERTLARYAQSADALIEVLHVAQQLHGYLSLPVLAEIARRLKLPPSRVLGVATFYHLFRFEADRAHTAVVCLGTACYTAGAQALTAAICQQERSQPGTWTVRTGRCLGSCGLAPIVVCDGEALSRATPEKLRRRLAATSAGR